MTANRQSFLFLLSAAALCLAGAAQAKDEGFAAAAREAFERDIAACPKIADPDSRKACRSEAYASRDEMRKGILFSGGEFERNKFARCAFHKDPEDRSYCERRMKGEGTVSGSIEGGGLLRELRVVVPAP